MSGRVYAQAGNVVLIIEGDSDSSGVFLYTVFLDGFTGDNWLPDLETAKEQAAHNVSGFPGGIGPWKTVPPEATNLIDFGKSLLRNSN